MNTKSKIRFLLVTSYAPPEHAGSGINAFNFAQYLNTSGIRTIILSFNRNFKYKTFEFLQNTKIIRIPYLNKSNFYKFLSSPIIIITYLVYILNANVVFIYGNKLILYELVIIFASLFGKKIVFQSLLNGTDDLKTILIQKKRFSWFYRLLFKKIDVYYSINKEFTERYIQYINQPEKILELSQGLNTSIFCPVEIEHNKLLKEKLKLPSGTIIISAGFVINRKGYREIFKALAEIDAPFTYLILGDYSFNNSHFLSKFSHEAIDLYNFGKSKLGEKLLFVGHVPNVNEYLQTADIFIHASQQEGLPNAILEAMGVGLPVITNNIPGLKDFFIQHNYNCLVYNKENDIIHLIKELIADKYKAEILGENAQKFINKSCSFQFITDRLLLKLYPENET